MSWRASLSQEGRKPDGDDRVPGRGGHGRTGSKFLVEAAGQRLLVDCGLYQGLQELRLRNWGRLPIDPGSIDWVVPTHAHIDHSGYLPRLIKEGFRGHVYATRGTADLLQILLPDSGPR